MSHKTEMLGYDVNKFLDVVSALPNLRDRILLRILFETGCSVNELCNIRASDYIQVKEYLQLNKIRFFERSAVISETLAVEIKKYIFFRKRRNDDYLFSQHTDKPLSVKRVEQLVEIIFDGKLRPMQIRYMHILYAASKGLSPDTICNQTGLLRQESIADSR